MSPQQIEKNSLRRNEVRTTREKLFRRDVGPHLMCKNRQRLNVGPPNDERKNFASLCGPAPHGESGFLVMEVYSLRKGK